MKFFATNGRSSRSGYSLVEVTLALLVVAIGLTATFALFPEGLRATRAAVDDTEIAMFAEYVFTTLDLTALVNDLKAKGHTVSSNAQSSGVATIIRVTKDGRAQLQGGADPRREGIVLGDGSL